MELVRNLNEQYQLIKNITLISSISLRLYGYKIPSVHTDKVHTVIHIFKVLMSVKVQGKLPGKDGLLQTRLIYS